MKNEIWLSSPHMGGSEINFIHEAFEQNWIAHHWNCTNVGGFEKILKIFLSKSKCGSSCLGSFV